MKWLVVGSGGREHALAWKLAGSPHVKQVLVAPGNAGTAREPGMANVEVGSTDIEALCSVARDNGVDYTVIGPEAPLADGIVDVFQQNGLAVFGPCREAARIESSKIFCKRLMRRHGVPTAGFHVFEDEREARRWLKTCPLPVVIKADGLAAGKGVVVARGRREALGAAHAALSGAAFGEAGRRVVVEDFVDGVEVSLMYMVNGDQAVPLECSQDHKTRDEGGLGPNTGGMGAFSPAPFADKAFVARVTREVVKPVIEGMAAEGTPFAGFLYAGLVVRPDGGLCVLEFNCRMGDPETQPVLARLRTDLAEVLARSMNGDPGGLDIEWDVRSALTIVMAAEGYPGQCQKGMPISGLEHADNDLVKVFHAGTRLDGGRVVVNGGRVLGVNALGADLHEARERALAACERITWDGAFYRRDIGRRAL